ncbi:uncharacterized protein L199_003277 [Kwoniella botswanensis]|uniref:uncharacterized protein n=1 Tax=Kwoniella botswanensis TaxID=1268659 RepID=UPI00315D1B96
MVKFGSFSYLQERWYIFLLVTRLYFALSPSYIYPDENSQGPEVIAGKVFGHDVNYTREFTSQSPVRSWFVLWISYGPTMWIMRFFACTPKTTFYALRLTMFLLSVFVGDKAIWELTGSNEFRKSQLFLARSSYVTWTYQMHTFSNSWETLSVLWSVVLIRRMVQDKGQPRFRYCLIFGLIFSLGIFNRTTFPAFIFIPCLRLLPYFFQHPRSAMAFIISFGITSSIAILVDTICYTGSIWGDFNPIITPLNNLLYNASTTNLAQHGLHPWYSHLLVNIPQLTGPAIPLILLQLPFSFRSPLSSELWWNIITALFAIMSPSLFPHQEARFLIPIVPLISCCIRLPAGKKNRKMWLIMWMMFNGFMGIFMGVYHQGGVIPLQMRMPQMVEQGNVYWCKTYTPPLWLLGDKGRNTNITTIRVFEGDIVDPIKLSATTTTTYLVAPYSSTRLDRYVNMEDEGVRLEEMWRFDRHLNLDDLDFEVDGIWETVERVWGRRGLILWKVHIVT